MDIITYILKSAAIASLFYFVHILLTKKDTFYQSKRYFLLVGIIASLVTPLISYTKTIVRQEPLQENFVVLENTLQASQNSSFQFSWGFILLAIYLVGVGVLLLKTARQLIPLLYLIKNANKTKVHGYTLTETKEYCKPFTFLNYVVYNPELHNTQELNIILQHEKTHAEQWHFADVLLSHFLTALHWFNPIAWLYKKEVEENLEFIADYQTVKDKPEVHKKQYQLTLLNASTPTHNYICTTNFYQSFIKKRIVMLNKKHSNPNNIWKLTVVLPLMALFFMSFQVTEKVEYTPLKTQSELHAQKAKVSVTITKATTDEQIKTYEKVFKSLDASLNINGVKRNANNEITALKIKAKSKDSQANYDFESSEGIHPIKISFSDGNISIAESSKKELVFHTIEGNEVFIHDEDGDDKTHSKVVWVEKNSDGSTKKNSFKVILNEVDLENEENIEIIHLNKEDGDEPIYILNGKRITKDDLGDISPEIIKEIEVLKGTNALEAYGKEGENGVIIIKSKKETSEEE